MNIEIKYMHPDAKADRAYEADAGLDLRAVSVNDTMKFVEYGTGVAVNIPKGYVGLLHPRSSISNKNLVMANSVGVIDAGYHGEIKVRFKRIHQFYMYDGYSLGDKIAQLVVVPLASYEINIVDEFSELSERGEGGFGSTGA